MVYMAEKPLCFSTVFEQDCFLFEWQAAVNKPAGRLLKRMLRPGVFSQALAGLVVDSSEAMQEQAA